MEVEARRVAVNIPSKDDFAARYPKRGRYAREEGDALFRLVMSWESFIACQCVTLRLGLPAVAGIAGACHPYLDAEPDPRRRNYMKQYIGALVCCLMEYNGFEMTGGKRAIPHRGFTVGEVYKLSE